MKEENKPIYIKPDSKSRMSFGRYKKDLAPLYKLYKQDNKFILEPIDNEPKESHWLMKPENKHLLERLEKAIRQKGNIKIDLDEFEKSLESE